MASLTFRDLPPATLVIGDEHRRQTNCTWQHVNPTTGNIQAEVPLAEPTDVDDAVNAARQAFPAWRALAPDARRDILLRWAGLCRERYSQIAELAAAEYGAPVAQSRARGVYEWISYYAGWCDKLDGHVVPTVLVRGLDYVVPEPYGVVGVIVPSNGPVFSASMTAVPALAAGNCVVLKPPQTNPFTCLPFIDWALEAGMPPGVINLVTGDAVAGDALVRHPGVDKIAFTGGVETGRMIMAAAATQLTPVTLELGGKSAHIVFDDAKLDSVIEASARLALLTNSGQACCVPTRMIVHERVYDRVLDLLRESVSKFVVGHPLAADTEMGPVISSASVDRVLGYVSRAAAGAGRVLVGGNRVAGRLADGFFVEPTVVCDVPNDSELAQNEIFGPVVSVTPFADDDQAVEMANATKYGLAAFVSTSNVGRAHRVAAELTAGYVSINGFAGLTPGAPFGGMKSSGHGREGGRAGIDEFLQLRNVFVNTAV